MPEQRAPLAPLERAGGRVRHQRKQFCPPGSTKYSSATQEAAHAPKDKEDRAGKENQESDSDDDKPIRDIRKRLGPKLPAARRRQLIEQEEDDEEDEYEPRDLAQRAQLRDEANFLNESERNPFALLDDDDDGDDDERTDRLVTETVVPGMSAEAWTRRQQLADQNACDYPDAIKGGINHLVRFMIKYGKNPENLKSSTVRGALEAAVREFDPDGQMHPMDIYTHATHGQRGLFALGWWQHNEKVSKGAGEKLAWMAFKGYMNDICSYARLYENVDRPHDEAQRMQVRYGTGWKHDSHPAYKAVHKAVNDGKMEKANVRRPVRSSCPTFDVSSRSSFPPPTPHSAFRI